MSLQVQTVLSFDELNEKLASFGVTSQPLDQYRAAWEQTVRLNLSALENAEAKDYTLIGYITNLRRHVTKDQREMAFATLEDYNGGIDLVFFARTWEINQDKVAEKTCIACKGKLDKSRDKPSFIVSSLLDLGKLRRSAVQNAGVSKVVQAADAVPADQQQVPLYGYAADGAAYPPGQGGAAGPGASVPGPAVSGQAASGLAALDESAGKKGYRELHIRLKGSVAGNEETLYSLRDFLIGNPGPAQVFIHVPFSSVSIRAEEDENGGQRPGQRPWEETVIRTDTQLNTAVDNENLAVLEACEAVAEVWRT
jgi:DNA polymerase-3 subunit alpha